MARDEAQVAVGCADGVVITREFAERALRARGIDRLGLSGMDRRILQTLAKSGPALGLRTLADLLEEAPRAILEVHEPYLIRSGLLVRTKRGRALTAEGRRILSDLDSPGRRTA
jgi:Holliday junction DNA helicase RuvB